MHCAVMACKAKLHAALSEEDTEEAHAQLLRLARRRMLSRHVLKETGIARYLTKVVAKSGFARLVALAKEIVEQWKTGLVILDLAEGKELSRAEIALAAAGVLRTWVSEGAAVTDEGGGDGESAVGANDGADDKVFSDEKGDFVYTFSKEDAAANQANTERVSDLARDLLHRIVDEDEEICGPLLQPSLWASLTNLSVTDAPPPLTSGGDSGEAAAAPASFTPDAADLAAAATKLRQSGFFALRNAHPESPSQSQARAADTRERALSQAVDDLRAAGWPPAFIFM